MRLCVSNILQNEKISGENKIRRKVRIDKTVVPETEHSKDMTKQMECKKLVDSSRGQCPITPGISP